MVLVFTYEPCELCHFSYEPKKVILYDDVTDKFKVSSPSERIRMFILQMPVHSYIQYSNTHTLKESFLAAGFFYSSTQFRNNELFCQNSISWIYINLVVH